MHKKIGSKNFFSKLTKLDPLVKNFLNSKDTQRVIRAYEIKSFTKNLCMNGSKILNQNMNKMTFIKFILIFQEMKLIKRINSRARND